MTFIIPMNEELDFQSIVNGNRLRCFLKFDQFGLGFQYLLSYKSYI